LKSGTLIEGAFVSIGMRIIALGVLALALGSCAGTQGQATPTSTATGAGANVPMPTVPVPDVSSADLNRKLLSQVSASEREGDLPLGSGDLIEVSVFEVPELAAVKQRIPNGGTITLPLVGAVPAAGRTASEVQTDIRERLQEKYLHNPQVSLFVHEHKSQRISVIGAVRTPGVFTLTSRLRLADGLAMAGGLADDAGPTLFVIRRVPAQLVAKTTNTPENGVESVMTAIDLLSLAAGRPEFNLPLQAGDVIEVGRAGTYYVGGDVNKPGSYQLKARTTLAQAHVVAGGLKDTADWDDYRLYRTYPDGRREMTRFSLNDFETGAPSPEIQTNDVVIVGRSTVKAFLYGLRDFVRFGVGATIP
jgi:polysaccharide export outer membrane protein